jgi:hypothetical protein
VVTSIKAGKFATSVEFLGYINLTFDRQFGHRERRTWERDNNSPLKACSKILGRSASLHFVVFKIRLFLEGGLLRDLIVLTKIFQDLIDNTAGKEILRAKTKCFCFKATNNQCSLT